MKTILGFLILGLFAVSSVHSGGNTGCSENYTLFASLSMDIQNFIETQINNNIDLQLSDLLLVVQRKIGNILAGDAGSLVPTTQDESILESFTIGGETAALCIVQFLLGA
ncbi:unnamed protein product [Chironomus riparius]|uniref:Uncharacterized protein n=1 Tax=Chironomus riparius TaxID=315576 RepID=A0A9N9S668_9DIPT|nr:unnamed protein product [Chironomus riparius]